MSCTEKGWVSAASAGRARQNANKRVTTAAAGRVPRGARVVRMRGILLKKKEIALLRAQSS
jgi:hypothetical protein